MDEIPGVETINVSELIKLLKSGEEISITGDVPIEFFLYKDKETGKTILDYFFEYNVDFGVGWNIYNILNNKETLKIYIKHDMELPDTPEFYSENNLFEEVLEDKKLIEILFEKNIINSGILKKIVSYPEIYDICIKYNREDCLELLTENILLKKKDNKSYLEMVLDRNLIPEIIDNSKSLEIARILYEIDRPDLLVSMNTKVLLESHSEEETYIEYLIKCCKDGKKVDFTNLRFEYLTNENIAKIYILFYENGLLHRLEKLKKEILMQYEVIDGEEVCLLETMLSLNKEATKEIVIYFSNVLYDLDINYYFEQYDAIFDDLDEVYFNLPTLNNSDFLGVYDINYSISDVNLSSDDEETINKFREVMSDGFSEEVLIEAVITYYKKLIVEGYPYAIIELKRLIEIKQNNINFTLETTNGSTYFQPGKGIYITKDRYILNNIAHELVHAMHYYLLDEFEPNVLEDVVERVKSRSGIIDKIADFSKKKVEEVSVMFDKVDKLYDQWAEEYYTEDKISEIKDFLQKNRQEQIETYLDMGYRKEDLDALFDDIYTLEEYMDEIKSIKCNELESIILENEYASMSAVADIIDAIFEGKFQEEELVSSSGETIISVGGHSRYYYQSLHNGYCEMLANYSTIIKSKEKDECLEILKDIVGEELVLLLQYCYEEELVNSKRYSSEFNTNLRR